jgi:hypothetical protein
MLRALFSWRGEVAFLQGVSGKARVFAWFFDGEFVVELR